MADRLVEPGEQIKPEIDLEGAVKLAGRLYGIKVEAAEELVGYDDKNYHLKVSLTYNNEFLDKPWPHGYVLKIMNSSDSKKLDFVEAQCAMMIYLEKHGIITPQPQKNIHGNLYSVERLHQKESSGEIRQHVVRLLTYVDGTLMKDIPWSYELHRDVGRYTAQLDIVLQDFSHPAYKHYSSLWNLTNMPNISEFLFVLKDERKHLVNEVITEFEKNVLTRFECLKRGIIHGDIHDQNLLCKQDEAGEWRVAAVLDLGDTHYSAYVIELALAMAYMMMLSGSVESGRHVVEGYCSLYPLPATELKLLKVCVCARICQSLVLGLYSHYQYPENLYVLSTQDPGWKLLNTLWSTDTITLEETWFGQPLK